MACVLIQNPQSVLSILSSLHAISKLSIYIMNEVGITLIVTKKGFKIKTLQMIRQSYFVKYKIDFLEGRCIKAKLSQRTNVFCIMLLGRLLCFVCIYVLLRTCCVIHMQVCKKAQILSFLAHLNWLSYKL